MYSGPVRGNLADVSEFEREREEELEDPEEDPLLTAQEGKGYGEDEGEREQGLETAE